jgi:hypothetical protein
MSTPVGLGTAAGQMASPEGSAKTRRLTDPTRVPFTTAFQVRTCHWAEESDGLVYSDLTG